MTREEQLNDLKMLLGQHDREEKENAQSIESKVRIYSQLSEVWDLLDDTANRLFGYHDDANNEDVLQIEEAKNMIREVMLKYGRA